MPTIRVNSTLNAGEATFPLNGSQYEYLPFNARVEFAIIETTTVPVGDVIATIFSGTDVLQQAGAITVKSDGATVYPDDFLLDDVAAAGERLSVELTSALGAADVQTTVKITPL